MSDIREWLEELGLGEYVAAFQAERVAVENLPELTDADLKDIGLPLGPRKSLLKAARELRQDGPEGDVVALDTTNAQALAAAPPREAERRQITVMFCDLVGSTALAEKLDPEELRGVMAAYRKAAGDVVARYDGHVAQYLGDGVMAYFGWPAAHEDDAPQAVRAGLGIVGAVAALDVPAALSVRIGIATGLVVVGESGADEGADAKLAVGETPNIAARIQALAEPRSVAIAQSTRRLLGGVFELDDLGAHALKGVSGRLQVHRVLGEAQADSRFEATHGLHLTPLVGRETEISLLLDRWDQAKDGEGQVVLLEGEAGIGKSRVTEVLRERLADEPHVRLRYQGSPNYTNSAFYPFLTQLERAAGFARDDSPEARLDKLEAVIDATAARPLFAAMLSLPFERYPPLNLEPMKQKEETIEALAAEVEALAQQQPVLMIFEDAHWYDPTTLETLGALIGRLGGIAALMVITYRPELTPPWSGHGHLTNISLNRLSRRQGADMVAKVTGGKALPGEVLDQIVAKTDGVPLFVEELTKTVLEAGILEEREHEYVLTGPLPPLAIPATLQDSLMARLDRLSLVKEIAQIGACLGREFSYELLAAVSPLRDNELQDSLTQLTNAELIFRRGTPPDATYSFKHALVQDAAYESLLKSRRQQLHTTIAQTLEERFPDLIETEPELAAHHYTVAGLDSQAIPFWLAAGERDIARFANTEAINNLHSGIGLLGGLQEGEERDRLEIPLQTMLGIAFLSVKGFGAAEVASTFSRAGELCDRVGDSPYQLPILHGLWVYHAMRAEWELTKIPANHCLALAKKSKDPGALTLAHMLVGIIGAFTGEFEHSLDHLMKGVGYYDDAQHRELALTYGHHPAPLCMDMAAWGHWLAGFPDTYLRKDEEALALARDLDHPLTSAGVIVHAALWDSVRDDVPRALKHAEETIALCKEAGIPLRQIEGEIIEGWAIAEQGETQRGIAEVEKAIDDWRAISCEIGRPWWLALLAKARIKSDEPDAALAAFHEALNIIEETNERAWEAELYRLKGVALLAKDSGDSKAIEGCFTKAIAVAQAQKAKSLELRAATSLARLWQRQGKTQEAHDLLAPVYDWFTEGFGTADLKDAKALLEELK